MGLDVRQPIGAMFAVVGVMLVLYGALTHGDSAMYERSLGLNVNVWWGAVMIAFGAAMLIASRMARRTPLARVALCAREGSPRA